MVSGRDFQRGGAPERHENDLVPGPNVDTIWFNAVTMRYLSLRYGVTWVATLPQTDFAAIRTLAGQSAVAPSGFEQIREFSLPKGGSLRLYRRA